MILKIQILFSTFSIDRERLAMSHHELNLMLDHEDLKKSNILVLANKQDVRGCMTAAEISKTLKLHDIKDHNWHIQSCCALTGEGLNAGLQWMLTQSGEG